MIRRLKETAKKGLHRVVWDFRFSAPEPVSFRTHDDDNLYDEPNTGHLAMPGKYFVSVSKFENNKAEQLIAPVAFTCVKLNNTTLPAGDQATLLDFYEKVSNLTRAVAGADDYKSELLNKIKYIKAAILDSPKTPIEHMTEAREIENKLQDINVKLNGDNTLSKREYEVLPGINTLIGGVEYSLWRSTQAPTETNKQAYQLAAKKFASIPNDLKSLVASIKKIEEQLEKDGAPYTPGRLPDWK